MKAETKHFLIEENFANAVLGYLSERPYKEVAPFIQGFQMLVPADVKEVEKIKGALSMVRKEKSLDA